MKLSDLSKVDLQWLADNYNAGVSFEDLHYKTGLTVQAVKRALAENGTISLSWHKTTAEHELLEYLKNRGITSAADFKAYEFNINLAGVNPLTR